MPDITPSRQRQPLRHHRLRDDAADAAPHAFSLSATPRHFLADAAADIRCWRCRQAFMPEALREIGDGAPVFIFRH